ncbi:ATP-binding protein [Limnohabitans sp.]|uniref:sensor histidine kinase n=1 Tax=Limnohabitans sp. TaxID=1907725 RepID=UPI00286F4396|nr:ATP-binding protein [Limnohabitans sp.]
MGYFKKALLVGVISALSAFSLHRFFEHIAYCQNLLTPVVDVLVSSVQDGASRSLRIASLPALLQNESSELRVHHVTFRIPAAVLQTGDEQLALFFPQILHGGEFYLNGQWFYSLPASHAHTRYAWYTPLVAPIPRALLKGVGQEDVVELRLSSFQRGFVVPSLYVSPIEPANAVFRIYQFINVTLAAAISIFCGVVGLFMLVIWAASRSERWFGYAGGAALLWGALFMVALAPALSLESWVIWRFLLYVVTGVLVLLVSMLLRRHVTKMGLIKNTNQTLVTQLLKRERDLEETYKQQKTIIRESAINEERNRILQDVHDGLGSRLINLLLEVRTHQISPEVLALDLQACIEDLRLLVSGQFVDNAPFTEVLDEFCQRAGRNLRAVGVQLKQDLDWVEKGELDGVTCLNILRIIQEMVSNTIKHSKAQNCVVKMKRNGGALNVEVWDDGVGFQADQTSFCMKRGLLGINKRIAEFSGISEFNSNRPGVHLKIQLKFNN